MATAVPSPRRRADAVRNYERVIAAAAEVLAEKGPEACVPEIAARAGVGKGTVYRCFPTKEHLVPAPVTAPLPVLPAQGAPRRRRGDRAAARAHRADPGRRGAPRRVGVVRRAAGGLGVEPGR